MKTIKFLLCMMVMVAALVPAAQADLLAEFTFDTDTTDTAGGHNGILSATGATVAGGRLVLDVGGYMDLASTFGAVSPLAHTTSDFAIVMDFKMPGGGTILSSSRDTDDATQQLLHGLSVHTIYRWQGQARERSRLYYDKYWAGDPSLYSLSGTNGDGDDYMDNTWYRLVIRYVADTGAGADLLEMNVMDGLSVTKIFSAVDPATSDIDLDTVRIGGTLNTGATYGLPGSKSGMTVDNVRIYDVADVIVYPIPGPEARNLAPTGTINRDVVANELSWVSGNAPEADPNLTVNGFTVDYFSIATSEVTDTDPNWSDASYTTIGDATNFATSPVSLTFDYDTTYFYRVNSDVTWAGN